MQAHLRYRHRAAEKLNSIVSSAGGLSRTQVLLLATLAILLIAGAAVSQARSRPSPVKVLEQTGGDARARSTRKLAVHVAGAVERPGLYRVDEGKRVADALEAAGGPTTEAAIDNLNLAARLRDGEKVLVPRVAAEPGAGSAPGATEAREGQQAININTAGIDELQNLPGIGPSLAQRIVSYREKNGQFSSVSELDRVDGIGPQRLKSLKDLVTI